MKKTLILLSLIFAAISCAPKDVQTLSVVPYPNDVKIKAGTFDIIGAEDTFLGRVACKAPKNT
jgi:hypothetical protein